MGFFLASCLLSTLYTLSTWIFGKLRASPPPQGNDPPEVPPITPIEYDSEDDNRYEDGAFSYLDNVGTSRIEEDADGYMRPAQGPVQALRTEIGGGPTFVAGWPSTGGVWVRAECDPVELSFLGVPRFEESLSQRESDPEAEDAFCERLERIGAQWFRSHSSYHHHTARAVPHRGRKRVELWFGWPEDGGVWALRTMLFESSVKGTGRLRNALTMEERCKAIEMLGGRFFEKWEGVDFSWHVLVSPLERWKGREVAAVQPYW